MKEIIRQYAGAVVTSVIVAFLLLLIYAIPVGTAHGVWGIGGEVVKEQEQILPKEEKHLAFDAYWGTK